MNKLIIGYQEGDRGDDALALGRVLAEILSAQPLVVDVALWPAYLMGPEDRDRALHHEFDRVLETARERLRGLDPDTHVLEGRSASGELAAFAERQEAGAIVIGSSHRSSVGRVMLGSVGSSLVHGAPCPVAVAEAGLAASDEWHLLRVGVAFDGSAEAWAALDAAIGIAERTHARLTVLTVADFPAYGLGTTWAVVSAEELVDAEEADKRRIMELGLARAPTGLPVEGRLLTGSADTVLADASGEFDLLVLGSRSHGPIGRTFLGGTATHLIHSARCSVLVLPRGEGAGAFDLGSHSARLKEPV